nr:sugar phosphate isomerase/epimerase [bacterium]
MYPKIAAQLYTVRNLCKTPENTLHTFKRLQQIGFETVQVSAICPMPAQQLKDICDETGMHICVTHTAFDRILEDTDAVIADHKLWNCRYIGLGSMPEEFRCEGGVDAFYKKVITAARKIRDAGLLFCYHNHRFEFERFGGQTMLERMDELFAADELGFILDTHWIQAGGASPAKVIAQFAHRTPIVHLKDTQIVSDTRRYAAVGEGNLDWDAIFAVCKETGVEYYPIEQDDCYGRDPVDCLKASFEFAAKELY